MIERKAVRAEFKARAEPGVFEARFSRFGNVDRYGDRVLPGAFTDVFKGDLPPVVWTHLWEVPPIGETLEARETEKGAEAVGRLFVRGDEDHEVARQVYTAMKAGALRQFSYAYTVADSATVEEDGAEIREIARFAELFEWGPTLVGVNPETELLAAPKGAVSLAWTSPVASVWLPPGAAALGVKRALPYKRTPLAPEDTAWDGAAEVARADADDLRAMCAWVDTSFPDDDNDGFPDAKEAYKLPHHRADGSHPVVLRGVQAAMAALLGARGGIDIPDEDRAAVYDHLARHYEDFDREPPELRSYTAAELAALLPDPPHDPGRARRVRELLTVRPL